MITKVVMPKLSDAMETGKVIQWLKREGDPVKGGDAIAEIETDKANVEIEAFGSGVLRKIVVTPGGQVPVGDLIGVIADPAEDIAGVLGSAAPAAPPSTAEAPKPTAPAPAVAPPQPASTSRPGAAAPAPAPEAATLPPTETYTSTPATQDVVPMTPPAAARPAAAPPPGSPPSPLPSEDGRLKVSPLARKVATQAGVDLRLVPGTGPGGRIVRRDVEAALTRGPAAAPAPAPAAAPPPAAPAAAPAAAAPSAAPARPAFVVPPRTDAEFEDLALTPMRAAIAKRLPLSKAPVPHFYVTSEVAMDRAWALRAELNALDGNAKVSITDMVIRACALALLRHPRVNASFQGESIRVYYRAHIGIAVALDDGLITPVLRDCDAKPLLQIAHEARDLAERARAGRLRASEVSGATFSISNLGMFEVEEFSAIINPPEGAILAVGSILDKPVVVEGSLQVGRRMKMTISCDHRVTDGANGARFLQDVKRLLEEPLRLVV
jgi:pyruvate dehydrogenase E2 component (dihydrolipoamide acetyltransferase)